MAIVTFSYITYNHNGTGVRHHHFSSSNNLTTLSPHSFPNSTNGNPGNDSVFAPDNWNNLPFAFMSINGAPNGNQLYTTSGNQSFLVGSSDVAVLVVYAPQGTPGPDGGPGVWVDAFNVETGTFSDDIHFITVLTPPTPPDNIDNPKTDFANSDGSISTEAPEHIRASDTIDSGSVSFIEWKQIMPPPVISNLKDQDLQQGESNELWFAFYQAPSKPPVYINPGGFANYDPWWWLKSWWGHGPDPGPDGSLNVWVNQSITAFTLAAVADRVSPALRTAVLEISLRQLSAASTSIEQEIKGVKTNL